MAETTDNPTPSIPRQDWTSMPMLGGYGFAGAASPLKLMNGTTLLPQTAALLGSGATENKSPYDSHHNGMSAGPIFPGLGGGLFGGQRYPGTYATYRVMCAHPTIALLRLSVMAPIMAAAWSYEEKGGKPAPKGAKELIERTFDKLRPTLLMNCLRALDYGFQAFENVWGEDREGYYIPAMVRGLLPDLTELLVDKQGQLQGVQNSGVTITGPQFFVYTYDREGDNWYGRSRLENCRRQWANWLRDDDNLVKAGNKVGGILPKIGFPADAAAVENKADTNYSKAQTLAIGLMNGQPVVMQNLTASMLETIGNGHHELAGKSLWSIDLLDMGNMGPQQAALVETLRYRDSLLCRGYLRSERSVIEAQTAGSRADAEAHTASISDTDCDMLHQDIVTAINETLVRETLRQNFGDEYADCVEIKPKQIVDESRIADQKILDAMLTNQVSFAELADRFDWDAFCQRNKMKLRREHAPWEDMLLPTDPMMGQPGDPEGDTFSDKPIDDKAEKKQERDEERDAA